MVADLERLLKASDVPTPYLLVGHSLGGIVVRQFANAHPDKVAGIVIVDSAHEEQFTKRFPLEVRQMARKMLKSMQPMIWLFASGIPALLVNRLPLTTGISTSATQSERVIRVRSGKHMRTMLAEMDAIVNRSPQPVDTLGHTPLVVLVHGIAQAVPNLSNTINTAYETAWQQMQHDLALLSSNGQHTIAEQNGHDIPLVQPELVIQAISSVLSENGAYYPANVIGALKTFKAVYIVNRKEFPAKCANILIDRILNEKPLWRTHDVIAKDKTQSRPISECLDMFKVFGELNSSS